MRKKKSKYVVIIMILAVVICGAIFIGNSSKWSELEFEAVVEDVVTQADGEIRLIVERTTNIYGNPKNSLSISEETKLFDANEKEITINDLQKGAVVTVSLKDAFTEEVPFYYPIVYEIQIIGN